MSETQSKMYIDSVIIRFVVFVYARVSALINLLFSTHTQILWAGDFYIGFRLDFRYVYAMNRYVCGPGGVGVGVLSPTILCAS